MRAFETSFEQRNAKKYPTVENPTFEELGSRGVCGLQSLDGFKSSSYMFMLHPNHHYWITVSMPTFLLEHPAIVNWRDIVSYTLYA